MDYRPAGNVCCALEGQDTISKEHEKERPNKTGGRSIAMVSAASMGLAKRGKGVDSHRI
jgi:hypothetical protein